MNLEKLAQQTLSLLDKAFDESQKRYFPQSPMGEMLQFHYSSGGKRLRPLLVFSAALAQDPKVSFEHCIPYALAVELLHNATLIHDDIQDEDRVRRNNPTLWVKYSLAQAINCGDAWFFVPQLLVQKASYGHELKLQLLLLMQEKILAVIEGQAQEFALKARFSKGEEIAVHEYLEMVEGKTSALFSLPLLGGALLGGCKKLEELELASRHLGRAFQMQDDLLDLWGNKGRGEVGSDIAEGKLSYPLVLLLSKISGEEKKRVQAIIGSSRTKTSAEDISEVISLMEARGIKKEAKLHFEEQLQLAGKNASVLPVANWLRELVQGL